MSETLGVTVLRHVAKHYRKRPESWTKFSDNFRGFYSDPATIRAELKQIDKKGCIHTMIRLYSVLVAGEQGQVVAEKDAIYTLCSFHGMRTSTMSIHAFNDECKSAADAIKFIEVALVADTRMASAVPRTH